MEDKKCEGCSTPHRCNRCRKTIHICSKCGKMTHDCDVCGENFPTLTEVHRHQLNSTFCKKARALMQVSFQQQIHKFGIMTMNLTELSKVHLEKAGRRKSCN